MKAAIERRLQEFGQVVIVVQTEQMEIDLLNFCNKNKLDAVKSTDTSYKSPVYTLTRKK